MTDKINAVRKFISENSEQEFTKETLTALFRSILEPVISDSNQDVCILIKTDDISGNESLLKRLNYGNKEIFGFNEELKSTGLQQIIKTKGYDGTYFLVILGKRYSACLLWDKVISYTEHCASACLLFNSKLIGDLSKAILTDVEYENVKGIIEKYKPDRRENRTLNSAVNKIANYLNEQITDTKIAEKESECEQDDEESKRIYENVSKQAKFISHEIKNNLSVINLYATICKKKFGSLNIQEKDEDISTSVNNAIKNIFNATGNISEFISNLRCIAEPEFSEISIGNLILDTISMCEEKAKNSGITVYADDIQNEIINTDKTKVQCTILNIIYNGIEACKQGNTVTVQGASEGNFYKIRIRNNGEKIPEEIK